MKLNKLLLVLPIIFSVSGCTSKYDTSYQPKELEAGKTYENVYLIMGQSNASGVSPFSFVESYDADLYQRYMQGNENVLITYDVDGRVENNYIPTKFGCGCNNETFGPEIGIAEVLSKKQDISYIIKASYGGTCLMTQYVSETGKKLELYNHYIEFIQKQLNKLEEEGKNPRLRGMFWMQGESDSFLNYKSKYDVAEQYFLDYIRHDLNDWIYEYFNFVDAYIFTRGICWVDPDIINACKERVCSNNDYCYCIKTNGEDENAIKLYLKCETDEGEDLAHYDSKSMLLLGQTAGEYLIK